MRTSHLRAIPINRQRVIRNMKPALFRNGVLARFNRLIVERMAYERVIPIVDITAKLLSNALSGH